MTRRWLAQRADSRQWLHTDLPIDGDPYRRRNAAGTLSLDLTADMGMALGDDGLPLFDIWGTILHMEENDEIKWSGIVIDRGEEGTDVEVECGSVMSYFYGLAWTGEISGINLDPADIIRQIVAHVQSYPDGNLNLEVVGSTSARIGTAATDTEFETGDGQQVAFTSGPYELNWWDNQECGKEIDRLAKEAPFDWIEESRWNEAKTDVIHTLRIADRLGGRRSDLVFSMDTNIAAVPQIDQDGDEYASETHALGAGEGKKSLRSVKALRRTGRLRRAKIIDQTKDIKTQARLDAINALLLNTFAGLKTIEQIEVFEHQDAPLGSWQLGDEIRVDLIDAARNPFSRWYTIVGEEMSGGSSTIIDLLPVYV